jgi:O-antigen/teichoic acid export membrane protein
MELQDDSITGQNIHPQEPTLKEKTAKGLFWGGISNGVQQALGGIIGIVLLKNLTPGDYGMVGMLAIFTAIANTLQESGFTAALINREFNKNDYNAVFWFNVFVSCLTYVILFFSAPLIARFFNQPDLIPLSRTIFLSFVASSLGIAHNAILFKKMMVKERAKIDIFSTTISGIVVIIMALKGYGYWALAFQTLAYTTIGSLLRWYFSPWKPLLSICFSPIKEMFGFSIKLMASSIITQIHANIFSVLLGRFYTKADVGYFSQGSRWSSMGTQFVLGMVNSVAQPIFVQVKDDKERQAAVFRKMIRFSIFISSPLLLGIAFVSRDFFALINTDWLPCVPILQLYCIWGVFAPLQILYSQMIISHGYSDVFFFLTIIYAIVQIGIAVVTLFYSIYWMAFTICAVGFLFLFVWHWFVCKLIPIRLSEIIKDVFPYLCITLVLIGISHLLSNNLENVFLRLFSKIIFISISYTLIVWKSNSIIFKESINFIKKHRE